MTSRIIRILFFFFLLLSTGSGITLYARNGNAENESIVLDKFVVLTDRDIYISGESLLYSITQVSSVTGILGLPATTAYVELLSTENNPLVRQMVRLENITSSFSLTIPDSVTTGLYILRVYTSLLKEGSADNYAYRRIFVINPVKAITSRQYAISEDEVLPEKSIRIAVKSSDRIENGDSIISSQQANSEKVKLVLAPDNEVVEQRSGVSVEVKMTDPAGKPVSGQVTVTVAKRVLLADPAIYGHSLLEGLNNEILDTGDSGNDELSARGGLIAEASDLIPQGEIAPSKSVNVELEGHLLRGQIFNRDSYEPMGGVKIMLAVRGQKARTYFTTSENDGRFTFLTNDYGIKEIVIMPVDQTVTNYYVEISDPFSERFTRFRRAVISIDTTMLGELNKSIIASQISGIYESNKRYLRKQNPDLLSWDFYGTPTVTVRPSDYIALESIREVVKEVLPSLYVVRQDGVQSFRIYNKIKGLPILEHPLVMVDGIPLHEIGGLLKLKPDNIKKIDLVTVTYYSEDISIGGVAAFYSYDGNLEIDESRSAGFRRLYTFYEPESVYNSPDYSSSDKMLENEADFRNTLYWNPVVNCNKQGEGSFSFYTGDEAGDFVIVVSYVSDDGEVVRAVHDLRVK